MRTSPTVLTFDFIYLKSARKRRKILQLEGFADYDGSEICLNKIVKNILPCYDGTWHQLSQSIIHHLHEMSGDQSLYAEDIVFGVNYLSRSFGANQLSFCIPCSK
jgi:hypothetical protein